MNDLTIKNSLADLTPVITQIDKVIDECLPIACAKDQKIGEALILAEGVRQLREIFYSNEKIKKSIQAMANTKLGFMTDRSPKILASDNKLKPYTYEEIAEVCIEALMKGYRLTGNEFNMIAHNMYPAKDGKFRFIMETKGLTDFEFGTSVPELKMEKRKEYKEIVDVQYAEVRCMATWKMNGEPKSIGLDEKNPLIFKIKRNAYMGDDAIIGKALSKLFSRVLLMARSMIIPESTDIDANEASDVIDIKSESDLVNEQLKAAKEEPAQESKAKEILEFFKKYGVDEVELCSYVHIENIEDINEEGLKKLREAGTDLAVGNKKDVMAFKEKCAEEFKQFGKTWGKK